MNILFLLAGRASRFKEEGYPVPKPLIDVRGKSMVRWAHESLSFLPRQKVIFVCLRDQEEHYGISSHLKSVGGKNTVVLFTTGVTEGAAVSALLARDLINTEEELVISNGDQYFTSHAFEEEVARRDTRVSGIIATFESTHPRWSFAKVNEKSMVTEVAEKVPISNNATVGVYYFRQGKDFIWAAEEMIRKDIRRNNEFYICPVYNELLGRGDKIKAVKSDSMWSLGTPEDVLYFRKYYKDRFTNP